MAPPRRRHVGASRRKRREDEGEDEGPPTGDVEDDSLSEGSADSHQEEEDADGEGSDSEDDTATATEAGKPNGDQVNGRNLGQPRRSSTLPGKPGLKATVSDTEAMISGLKISGQAGEEVRFDETEEGRALQTGRTPSAPPTEPKRESFVKKRREHERYVKERDQNPAFVPTRGSFFLHDKRTNEGGNGRPFNKGKSRPVGLIVDGNARRYSDITNLPCPVTLTNTT